VEGEALLAGITGRRRWTRDFDLLRAGMLEVSETVQYHPLLREYQAAEHEQVLNALQEHDRQVFSRFERMQNTPGESTAQPWRTTESRSPPHSA
jgi:hypothetical protein